MSVDLDTLKQNLRIDGNEDDTLLQNDLLAATIFVKNAVGDLNDTDTKTFFTLPNVSPLIDTAILALASSYYENSSSTSTIAVHTVDAPVNAMIGTLRGMYNSYLEGLSDQNAES